jgi:hypothetical protein
LKIVLVLLPYKNLVYVSASVVLECKVIAKFGFLSSVNASSIKDARFSIKISSPAEFS